MPGGVGPVNYPPCLYDTALDTVTALPATYTGANFQCNNGHIYPNILANVHNQSWCGLTWSPIKYTYSGTACPLNSTKTSSDSVTAVTNPGSQVANGGSAVIGSGGTNVDCVVGPFTDTTTCDPAGSGFLMQQANITIQPSGQGAACGPTSQVGTTRCPVDCVVSWADGACNPNTGMLTQTGTVTTQAAGTGTACPTSLTRQGTKRCTPTGWTDQGFWTDNGNYRILYDSIGNFPTLEAGVAAALAKNPKYNIIGMQNGKEVMAGVNNDYTRYGRSDNCTNPFGCPWVSRIITKDDSYKNDPMVDLPGWRTQSGFWNIDYMFPTNLGTHNTMAECQAYAQNSFPNINVVSMGQNDTLNGKHPYCWGATNVDHTKNGQKSCGNPASGCFRATRIATFDKNAGSGTSAQQAVSGQWTDKGFWNDSSVRTLPNSIGVFTSTKDCIDTAIKAGYTRVGLQAGGQCWAGNQSNDYAKYMAASGCTRDLGCDWVNHVFINDDGATMSVGSMNNSPSNWTDNYRNGQIVALNTKCPSLSVATIQGYDNAKIASTLTGSCPFTATQLAGTRGYPPFSDGSCNPGLELDSSNNTCQDIPYDYSN